MCIMEWLEINAKLNSAIVIDDMASSEATDDTAKLFTVDSHHLKLNVIFIYE